MDKFITHNGIAAPLMRNNIDTDTIIPSREMRAVSKSGLADGLFAAWRYRNEKTREPNPDFVLNLPQYKNASILITGDNFGCGSSREHAVWALKEYGIRCVIAEGFGSIFLQNCVRNGVLPVKLAPSELSQLVHYVSNDSTTNMVIVDLKTQCIQFSDNCFTFVTTSSDREMLLEGLDPIAVTQKLQHVIDDFAERDQRARPWLTKIKNNQ